MTIDWWTLGIQSVNIVILIWLLGHFFWRPVAAMIEQRRVATREAFAQVEVQRTQVSAALADIERTRAGFAGEREALLAAARKAAEQERAAILAKAAREAAALEAEAKVAAAREVEAANRAWTERASRLAVAIAGRLVERLQGPAVQDAFMDGLLKAVRELPESARRAVTAPDVRLRGDQRDADRTCRPAAIFRFDRRGAGPARQNRFQIGRHPDRRLRIDGLAFHRRQQLARRSRIHSRGHGS